MRAILERNQKVWKPAGQRLSERRVQPFFQKTSETLEKAKSTAIAKPCLALGECWIHRNEGRKNSGQTLSTKPGVKTQRKRWPADAFWMKTVGLSRERDGPLEGLKCREKKRACKSRSLRFRQTAKEKVIGAARMEGAPLDCRRPKKTKLNE